MPREHAAASQPADATIAPNVSSGLALATLGLVAPTSATLPFSAGYPLAKNQVPLGYEVVLDDDGSVLPAQQCVVLSRYADARQSARHVIAEPFPGSRARRLRP